MPLSPGGAITLSTIRLECPGPEGDKVGTGFFYHIPASVPGRPNDVVIGIVTNKHVVAGATTVRLTITWIPEASEPSDDMIFEGSDHRHYELDNLRDRLIMHPDDDIDLCVICVTDLFDGSQPSGRRPRNMAVLPSWHLPAAEIEVVRPIEQLLMVGYPNGLWDEVNNLPLVRRGLSASHILKNWNGRRMFMIDAACFPGSSGSPVFLYEDGMVLNGPNSYGAGSRARFVGVLFAGPLIDQDGQLVEREIPTATTYVPVMRNMMNLGYVIHASVMDDFTPLVRQVLVRQAEQRFTVGWAFPPQ